ncbi:MAG: hypothetical protein II244_02825 [Clostridia bacterium]|nr:hypothetical protein [Clostridia bacterium]
MSLLRNNLLKKALKLIPGESYQYLKYQGEIINDFGISVPSYATPVIITPQNGIVQSPENSLYQQLGLSLDKNYKIFYGATSILGNEAQPQPDRFIYDGKTFETVRNTDWFNYDGWCGVLAVEIKRDRENDAT